VIVHAAQLQATMVTIFCWQNCCGGKLWGSAKLIVCLFVYLFVCLFDGANKARQEFEGALQGHPGI
jgi:hypothetical protein